MVDDACIAAVVFAFETADDAALSYCTEEFKVKKIRDRSRKCINRGENHGLLLGLRETETKRYFKALEIASNNKMA